MSLSPGTRLGPYEILAPLGAGGMGEVYRARDTRLGREVAIKVLPASFSSDTDRLRRFEQEARAASALNHPNIVTLHDIGSNEGAPYVVTELLEGETLRSRLVTGALSPRKATDYATQIAQGLAAAHEKGIVHRDLKPENLFVTENGRVKILDFGLAKLIQPEASPKQQTSAPTASLGTEPGVVMGTVGYMSPEQVKGQAADHRSDIFSFGAILYEMLSGRRAFKGDSVVETMSAILKEDPPAVSETNRNLSPGLERLVRHCLEKAPAQRFQSASDIAFDLETLSGGPAGADVRRAGGKRAFRLPLVATLAALAAALLAGAWLHSILFRPATPKSTRLTFRRGWLSEARFAPDGQTVVYSAAWNGLPFELSSTRVGSTESRILVPGAALAGVSSSGEVAIFNKPGYTLGATYLDVGGTLARVPLAGGAPKNLLENTLAADWTPDGKDLAVVRFVDGKSRIELPIGKVLYETGGSIGAMRISPRGDRIAFIDYPVAGDSSGGSIAVVDLHGRKQTLVSTELGSLAWSPDGTEIWYALDDLMAVSLSGRTRVVFPGFWRIHDTTRDGRVLLTQQKSMRETYGKSPHEDRERNLSWLDASLPIALGANGETVLLNEYGEGGGVEHGVYLRAMDAATPVRVGDGSALDLSPDEKWIAAVAHLGTSVEKIVLLPTGSGQPRELPTAPLGYETGGFSLDGKRLVFGATANGGAPRMYVQDLAGGIARAVTAEGIAPRGTDGRPNISSDGRVVVRDAQLRLLIQDISGGEPRPIPGVSSEEYVAGWTADGRMLYVVKAAPLPARVSRLDPLTGKREPWREILPADPVGVAAIDWLSVTPDGGAYVYSFVRRLSDLYVVEGLK